MPLPSHTLPFRAFFQIASGNFRPGGCWHCLTILFGLVKEAAVVQLAKRSPHFSQLDVSSAGQRARLTQIGFLCNTVSNTIAFVIYLRFAYIAENMRQRGSQCHIFIDHNSHHYVYASHQFRRLYKRIFRRGWLHETDVESGKHSGARHRYLSC